MHAEPPAVRGLVEIQIADPCCNVASVDKCGRIHVADSAPARLGVDDEQMASWNGTRDIAGVLPPRDRTVKGHAVPGGGGEHATAVKGDDPVRRTGTTWRPSDSYLGS